MVKAAARNDGRKIIMRILHINSADDWGGGEVHVALLCKQLIDNGHDIVLSCRPASAIDKHFRNMQFPVLNLSLKGAGDLYSAFCIANYCREHSIEIVHAHLGRDYWLAFFVKLLYGNIKVVFTRHLLFPLKNNIIHKMMYQKSDAVIAVSKAVEKVITTSGFVDSDRLKTIYNGIVVENFANAPQGCLRHELGFDVTTSIIGIIGQISPHKGQDVFLRSISSIMQNNPNSKFVIVGDDFRQGDYIQELKNVAIQLGIAEHVFFLGPRKDIPQIMKDLDVFVLASRNESFGLVAVEAMAAGVPVVATAAGGVSEIVEHEKSGFLISIDDDNMLAEAVCKVLKNPSLAKKHSENAMLRVRSLFSIESMTEQTVEIYHEVLKV